MSDDTAWKLPPPEVRLPKQTEKGRSSLRSKFGVVVFMVIVWSVVSCFIFLLITNAYHQEEQPTQFKMWTVNAVAPSAKEIKRDNRTPITHVIKMSMNPTAVSFAGLKKSVQEVQSQANVATLKPTYFFDPNKAIICHIFSRGRFGNHLFEYASVLGIAAKTNKSAYFVNGEVLRGILKYPPVVPKENRPQLKKRCRRAKRLKEKAPCTFDKSMLSLQPGVDYSIREYLQSWWYFDGFQEEVRKAVIFTDDIVRNATRRVMLLRQMYLNITLVGIHNRRGDLTNRRYARQGYMTAPADFFQRAMTYFRQRFSPLKFIVVGNDIKWNFKNILPVNNDVIHLEGNSAVMDMQILSLTDHMIRTVGTFGWWAAYKMSGKPTVVCLKEFAKGMQRQVYSPTANDYLLPEWILM